MKLLRILLPVLGFALTLTPVTGFAAETDLFGWRGLNYLEERQAISGVHDSMEHVSRADFVELVTTLLYQRDLNADCFKDLASELPVSYDRLFKEVTLNDPHAVHLCVGLKTGIIRGNKDGTFRGNDRITVAEAAHILYRAYDVGPLDRQGLPGQPWYFQTLWDMNRSGFLPSNFMDRPNHMLTIGEAAEMLIRLRSHEARLRSAGEYRLTHPTFASSATPRTTFVAPVEPVSTPVDATTMKSINLTTNHMDPVTKDRKSVV